MLAGQFLPSKSMVCGGPRIEKIPLPLCDAKATAELKSFLLLEFFDLGSLGRDFGR